MQTSITRKRPNQSSKQKRGRAREKNTQAWHGTKPAYKARGIKSEKGGMMRGSLEKIEKKGANIEEFLNGGILQGKRQATPLLAPKY